MNGVTLLPDTWRIGSIFRAIAHEGLCFLYNSFRLFRTRLPQPEGLGDEPVYRITLLGPRQFLDPHFTFFDAEMEDLIQILIKIGFDGRKYKWCMR